MNNKPEITYGTMICREVYKNTFHGTDKYSALLVQPVTVNYESSTESDKSRDPYAMLGLKRSVSTFEKTRYAFIRVSEEHASTDFVNNEIIGKIVEKFGPPKIYQIISYDVNDIMDSLQATFLHRVLEQRGIAEYQALLETFTKHRVVRKEKDGAPVRISSNGFPLLRQTFVDWTGEYEDLSITRSPDNVVLHENKPVVKKEVNESKSETIEDHDIVRKS